MNPLKCPQKWVGRNFTVHDCNGKLEGFEMPPHATSNHSSPLVTIQRTDGMNGITGAIQRALTDLGGLRRYITPQDNVALKVNIASGLPENPASYTNPRIVEFLADEIAKICDPKTGQCAKPYFVEANNSWMDMEYSPQLLEDFGYMELIDRHARHGKPNIPFIHLTTGKKWEGTTKEPFTQQVRVHFQHPKDFITDVSAFLLDPKTKIISVSKAKHHQYTGVSLDSKNLYGAYPESVKSQYHVQGVEGIIAAAARIHHPVLTLSDWSPMCAGWFGPNFCIPFDAHTIVMANDIQCGDQVGCELAGVPATSVKHLQINRTLNGQGSCAMAPASVPLDQAKHPQLIAQAPPPWWFTMQEALNARTGHALPRELIRAMGAAVYPLTRVINQILPYFERKD